MGRRRPEEGMHRVGAAQLVLNSCAHLHLPSLLIQLGLDPAERRVECLLGVLKRGFRVQSLF